MTQTILITTIESNKPLPQGLSLTDILSERAYNWLQTKGVSVAVKTVLVPQKKEIWEEPN